MTESRPPDEASSLQTGITDRDKVAMILRGLAAGVPFAGGLLAEAVNHLIPNQRADRIESYLLEVARRLEGLEHGDIAERLRRPESLDLLEDGAYQAIRALSEERRQQIATLVAEGITDRARTHLESKRVLRLLGELDDAEVIMLASFLHKNRHDRDFRARHAGVLQGPAANLRSRAEELDQSIVHQAGELHLLRLGLLREGGVSGRNSPKELSPLGRLLLRFIGLAAEGEF